MYALLFPSSKNGSSSLTSTTTDETYDKIFKALKTAKTPLTAELVKSSEVTQYLELKTKAAMESKLNCLTEIEKMLIHLTKRVESDKKFADSYRHYTMGGLLRSGLEEFRLELKLQNAAFFSKEEVKLAISNFHREVERLGECRQRRIENAVIGIKSTTEDARSWFRHCAKNNSRVDNDRVDSRIKRVCENFDAVKEWSQDEFLRGVQEAKKEFDMAVNEAAGKFEWETTMATLRFCGVITGMSAPSRPKQHIQTVEDNVIQIQFEEPRAHLHEWKPEAILRIINDAVKEVQKLKEKQQNVLTNLAAKNAKWISSLEPQSTTSLAVEIFCVCLIILVSILVCMFVISQRGK